MYAEKLSGILINFLSQVGTKFLLIYLTIINLLYDQFLAYLWAEVLGDENEFADNDSQ